jgi:hypothetical protein
MESRVHPQRRYLVRYYVPIVTTMEGTLDDVYDTGCYNISFILLWKVTKKPGTDEKELTLHRKIRTTEVYGSEETWAARPREEGTFFIELVEDGCDSKEVDAPVSQEELNEIVRAHCANNPRMVPSEFASMYWEPDDDPYGWGTYVTLFTGVLAEH